MGEWMGGAHKHLPGFIHAYTHVHTRTHVHTCARSHTYTLTSIQFSPLHTVDDHSHDAIDVSPASHGAKDYENDESEGRTHTHTRTRTLQPIMFEKRS